MSRFTGLGAPRYALMMAALVASLAGCSTGKKTAIYDHETFGESQTFSRTYPVSDVATCEAARRALLSQGYIITSSDPKIVSGHKSFQQTGDTHMEISFNVVCAPDTGQGATMFANALQDRYALKKTNNSASLGVGVLGSVSMPIGSTDDSMVKVASETVTSDKFYDRYFALVEMFLPKEAKPNPKPHADDAPKGDLGVPEPAAQKPGAQAAPVVPLHPAAVEPGVLAAVVSPAAAVAVVPAAGSAGAVAAQGAAPGVDTAAAVVVESAPVGSTAAVAPAGAVAVVPASVAPAPAAAANGASASVAPVANSAAVASAPVVQPAVVPAASLAPAVAAAPAVAPVSVPVVPVAPGLPAGLAPVDETVQSQAVVPPADIDAPISATQASTP